MDKIIIKPTAKEIIIPGKPEDGTSDVFTYNYENEDSSNLGSLFIIGHVQPSTNDTSYMVNLAASLAKREYYSQPGNLPRDAFSKTLKKINEVLQEFFRDKNIRINIGIFAVAGENIFISKLGKFKIILTRDDKHIDILNDINLFSKEHIQEKEFSNIISGKVAPKDKILAFYPARQMVSREKIIKENLLALSGDQFVEKLNGVKQNNDSFCCTAVFLTIDKHREPTVIKSPQPKELIESLENSNIIAQTASAKILNQKPINSESITENLPNTRPSKIKYTPIKLESVGEEESVSKNKLELSPINKTGASAILESKSPEKQQLESNVSYPDSQRLSPEPLPSIDNSTLLRPSEFSLAKKLNFIQLLLKKIKPAKLGTFRPPNSSNKKYFATGTAVIIIIATVIILKATLIPALPVPGIDSPEEKATNELIREAEAALEAAKAHSSQNNLLEARKLLRTYFEALNQETQKPEQINQLKKEITISLDQMDKAVETVPTLAYEISPELGRGSLIATLKNKVTLVYATATEEDSGNIIRTEEGNTKGLSPVKGFDPIYVTGVENEIVMINEPADKIGSLNINGGNLTTSSLSISGLTISMYQYQDNLYILTSDNIFKITDAFEGKNAPVSWLNQNVQLQYDPALLAIDGNIYVINKNGILTTYHKGDKKSEINMAIPVDSNDALLTTKNSKFIYLVDKKFGRIYVITKENGVLLKTLKLGSNQSIVSASIDDDETIYVLTPDNKVWKIVP